MTAMGHAFDRRASPVGAVLALLVLTLTVATGRAEPAHFWLSFDGTGSAGPQSPSIIAAENTPRRVHIWAQPRTNGQGDYHAETNPYLSLGNIALNLVSPQSSFAINANEIEVYNPVYGTGASRFEHVHDSNTGLTGTTSVGDLPVGMAAGVVGLQGFTFDPSVADGLGGACDPLDTTCVPTGESGDAWLVASLTLTPTASVGEIELYLQVGLNGMSHVGEDSSAMMVMFGVDTQGAEPALYDPSVDRQVTLAGDDPDAVLTLVRPGDYDADGDVDADDYSVWYTEFGTSAPDADGNADGVVDAEDYAIWRDNRDLPMATLVVPEPGAWLVATLMMGLLTAAGRYSARYSASSRSAS